MAVGMGGNGVQDDQPGILDQDQSEVPTRRCKLAVARGLLIFLLLAATFWAAVAALVWLL
jgi:hypothetical protein